MLGYVSYGLSIYVYTYAQRGIGASRTSTYYAVAPFIGSALSIIFLGEQITWLFCIALLLIAIGAWLAAKKRVKKGEYPSSIIPFEVISNSNNKKRSSSFG